MHRNTTPSERTIDSQPSWVIRTPQVELAVTQIGAHMAPVIFERDKARAVQPYYISPWQNEGLRDLAPPLVPLRGDFFCLPFGANDQAFRGEKHPAHGETAGRKWKLESCRTENGTVTLALSLRTKVRPGHVRRDFFLRPGHNAVYTRTTIHGFAGPAPFAHHANLRLPQTDQALLISTSKFTMGRTYPILFQNPGRGEYQWVAADASFTSLSRIPSQFVGEKPGDFSALPARRGFCDLLQQFEKPTSRAAPSWVAAVNTEENWLWFALKDPRVMPGRLFWHENHGRHSAPWYGRNGCLGLEDGCMYFAEGLAASCQPNAISRAGIPTFALLKKDAPFEVRYIQGAVLVPKGFGRVRSVKFDKGAALFQEQSGKVVRVAVDHQFLFAQS